MWSNLVRLKLKKHGARVVHAGIIPHATFGAELYAPAGRDIKFISTMLGSAGRGRPLGVSNDFMISVSPGARDPVSASSRPFWADGFVSIGFSQLRRT